MTQPGIEPRSPGPLANTLTARPMSGLFVDIYYIYIYIVIYRQTVLWYHNSSVRLNTQDAPSWDKTHLTLLQMLLSNSTLAWNLAHMY